MSSAADAGAVDESAVAEEKPARKFPPPCWTQEETLALIEAYRERWYAVRRGYLRTPDWDAVALAVASRCPDASPAKTSAQCRHKMEKLRQRYRAEKQRSLSYSTGRFSNWFFFENMDALENGTPVSAARSNQWSDEQNNSGNDFGLKNLIDQSILKLKLSPKNGTKYFQDSNPNFGFDQESRPINFGSRVSNGYSSYLDVATTKEEQMDALDFGIRSRVDGISLPTGIKAKKFGGVSGELKNGFDVGTKKIGKLDRGIFSNFNCDECSEYNGKDQSDGFVTRVLSDRNFGLPSMGNHGGVTEHPNLDSGVSHRFLSSLSTLEKGGNGGGKRGRESIDQIASLVRLLGEEFIKMEKMKMEMAKEIEGMRMEMEMKRNEMILESQKQITNAFVRVLSNIKKKAKTDEST